MMVSPSGLIHQIYTRLRKNTSVGAGDHEYGKNSDFSVFVRVHVEERKKSVVSVADKNLFTLAQKCCPSLEKTYRRQHFWLDERKASQNI